ncbi:hypothetical protein [Leifsonia sp. LS-T14]|uniref:hypothetical protein n=1 Tax=unclassified Leifsonia TaxID=2663824 RepID=UPI0035A5BDE4
MMLPPTPRVLFLRELVGAIRRDAPAGRVVVAVDAGSGGGGESSGGIAFADDLALVFRESGADTFRASLGGFHSSRAFRTRLGPETPESYYRDGYDYVTLRRVLLDPFRLGGSAGFQTSAFDAMRDRPVEARWLTAGQDAVLVLDGSSRCARRCGASGPRPSCSRTPHRPRRTSRTRVPARSRRIWSTTRSRPARGGRRGRAEAA